MTARLNFGSVFSVLVANAFIPLKRRTRKRR